MHACSPTALVMSWLVIGDSHSPGCRSIGAISSALQARLALPLAAVLGRAAHDRSGTRIAWWRAGWGGAARQRAACATSSGSRARFAGWCRSTAPRIQKFCRMSPVASWRPVGSGWAGRVAPSPPAQLAAKLSLLTPLRPLPANSAPQSSDLRVDRRNRSRNWAPTLRFLPPSFQASCRASACESRSIASVGQCPAALACRRPAAAAALHPLPPLPALQTPRAPAMAPGGSATLLSLPDEVLETICSLVSERWVLGGRTVCRASVARFTLFVQSGLTHMSPGHVWCMFCVQTIVGCWKLQRAALCLRCKLPTN